MEPGVILPIKDDGGGGEGSGGKLALIPGTKAMFLMAAGALSSDPRLERSWWLFIAYITLFLFSLLVWILSNPKSAPSSAQRHPGKLLAAACILRVLTLAFQAWCGLIPLKHLGAAVPAALQVSRTTTLPLANC
ncbi:unnamed protein product [Spirodela intermedia]|uniref:Uncharacterized protein n=1 Tax=Spirodela intermedia TaxID=51605 RepID=A0A7I8LCH3_SPIIN|nr:unnamed protein product [Spirodela intermedia]CAA7407512.1 unnamed protein product [Spirodela intermedia]